MKKEIMDRGVMNNHRGGVMKNPRTRLRVRAVCVSVCDCVCVSVYLSVFVSVCLSVCLPAPQCLPHDRNAQYLVRFIVDSERILYRYIFDYILMRLGRKCQFTTNS